MIYTREKILNTQRLQRPRLWEKAVSDALHTATITVRNDIGIHIKNNTATVNSRLSGHLGKTEFILLSWGINGIVLISIISVPAVLGNEDMRAK